MRRSRIHSVLGIAAILVCSIGFTTTPAFNEEVSAVLLTEQKVFKAGSEIGLDFKLSKKVKTELFLHGSYGSTLLYADNGSFSLPSFMTKKRGRIDFSLYHQKKVLHQGFISIISNTESRVQLESYVGPPSSIAGGEDYTMQVVIATDIHDNPLPDSTTIYMKQQFQELEKETIIASKDLIGWVNLFSYDSAGRVLLASKVGPTTSKEFTVDIYPSLGVDFTIQSSRRHQYADGNQLTEFTTSEIKDRYGNTISDGTLVEFAIMDKKGSVLHTQGSTIKGVATAKMLHPDHPETWHVKAYIQGIAESNTLELTYKSVLDDFEVTVDAKNRKVIIGPILSFMEQRIPDGATVVLNIFQKDTLLARKTKSSLNGMVIFDLKNGNYPAGNYTIQLEALGVQKTPITIELP